MRSGTTLLHRLLDTHAAIYVPRKRKEIHFFDKNYDKGLSWYAEFFPGETCASKYSAIGEVTPRYVFEEEVPRLVKATLPDAKFILMLRNPVDRLYSHYRFASARSGKNISFHDFASGDAPAVRRGFYAQQLTRWLNLFSRDRFLILLFEEFTGDPDAAVERLAGFLGVDAQGFDKRVFAQKAAASFSPRLPRLYKAGIWLQKFLIERDLDRTYAILRAGRGFLKKSSRSVSTPKLTMPVRRELYATYAKDISNLETLLERNLEIWRPRESSASILGDAAPAETRPVP